jgi:hypothetical protein
VDPFLDPNMKLEKVLVPGKVFEMRKDDVVGIPTGRGIGDSRW